MTPWLHFAVCSLHRQQEFCVLSVKLPELLNRMPFDNSKLQVLVKLCHLCLQWVAFFTTCCFENYIATTVASVTFTTCLLKYNKLQVKWRHFLHWVALLLSLRACLRVVGCYGLYPRQKPTELAHSFFFCSYVCFCLYGPFNCISFHKFSRQLFRFFTLFFWSYFCHTGPFNYIFLLWKSLSALI